MYQDVHENEDLIIKNNIIENVSELNNITNDDINQLTNSISTLSLNEVKIESDDDIEPNQNDSTKRNNCSNPSKTSGILPKINTKVIYHNPDTNSWNEVLVFGKAGKIKNIKSLQDNSHQSVACSKIEGWKNIKEEVLIIKHGDKNIDTHKAKSIEFENWKVHKVYEKVENIGQSFISVRWIINQKCKGKEVYYKARLVARRFEESNLIDTHKDSPTCCKEIFRLLSAIVVTNKW